MQAYFLFFISGFAALIYELLWFRQLGFIFGNTVHAATTVVTAYMLGLALGAHIFGRWAARVHRPLRLFGLLECGIGLYALCMPLLFALVRLAYRWGYQHVSDSMEVLTPLRFAFALLVLLVPTALMGGTLPLLSQALIARSGDFGKKLSWLYGLNTLGAVTGILGAGFLFIPSLGLRNTNLLAAAGNFTVGLLAITWGARWLRANEASAPREQTIAVATREKQGAVYAAVALSGFIALALEVVWFRALILVFGSTTYSFCAMLATFLFGIGAGSLALGWIADRVKHRLLLFAAAQCAVGAYTILSMPWFNAQPALLIKGLMKYGFEWSTLVTAQFLITLSFLLVPTLLMGLTFNLAGAMVRAFNDSSSRAVGRVYAANTIGCVLGSLAGGFLLLPAIGIEKSLMGLAALSLVVGALLAVCAGGPVKRRVIVAAAGLALAVYTYARPPNWNRQLMAAGPYFSSWSFVNEGRVAIKERLASEELVYYREGVTATASVTKTDDESLYFSMDGKVEADTTPRGMVVQRMIGHLPMLFHPNPHSAMNLGLGAGVTFGSLGCYPLDWLEVVEIEPAAVGVAHVWSNYNHNIVSRPDVKVTINDGRNHFFCTPRKYDVITSDPFEPVVGGASHLFTVEHFQQARACLAPGGIMCQWVPMYEMTSRDFLTILRSFVNVFPRSVLFIAGLDIVMLGFHDDVVLDPETVKAKYLIPAVSNSLANVGFDRPEMILGMFVADMSKASGFVGEGPLNVDNFPVIEFSAPKSQVKFTAERNQEILLQNFTDIPDELLREFDADAARGIRLDHDALKLALQSSMQRAAGEADAAYATLMRAFEMAPGNPVIRNDLAAVLLSSATAERAAGQMEAASYHYQMALQVNPREFWALHELIMMGILSDNLDYAGKIADQALSTYPDSPLLHAQVAKYWFTKKDWDRAMSEIRTALELAPRKAKIWEDYALLLEQMGNYDEAGKAAATAAKLRSVQ